MGRVTNSSPSLCQEEKSLSPPNLSLYGKLDLDDPFLGEVGALFAPHFGPDDNEQHLLCELLSPFLKRLPENQQKSVVGAVCSFAKGSRFPLAYLTSLCAPDATSSSFWISLHNVVCCFPEEGRSEFVSLMLPVIEDVSSFRERAGILDRAAYCFSCHLKDPSDSSLSNSVHVLLSLPKVASKGRGKREFFNFLTLSYSSAEGRKILTLALPLMDLAKSWEERHSILEAVAEKSCDDEGKPISMERLVYLIRPWQSKCRTTKDFLFIFKALASSRFYGYRGAFLSVAGSLVVQSPASLDALFVIFSRLPQDKGRILASQIVSLVCEVGSWEDCGRIAYALFSTEERRRESILNFTLCLRRRVQDHSCCAETIEALKSVDESKTRFVMKWTLLLLQGAKDWSGCDEVIRAVAQVEESKVGLLTGLVRAIARAAKSEAKCGALLMQLAKMPLKAARSSAHWTVKFLKEMGGSYESDRILRLLAPLPDEERRSLLRDVAPLMKEGEFLLARVSLIRLTLETPSARRAPVIKTFLALLQKTPLSDGDADRSFSFLRAIPDDYQEKVRRGLLALVPAQEDKIEDRSQLLTALYSLLESWGDAFFSAHDWEKILSQIGQQPLSTLTKAYLLFSLIGLSPKQMGEGGEPFFSVLGRKERLKESPLSLLALLAPEDRVEIVTNRLGDYFLGLNKTQDVKDFYWLCSNDPQLGRRALAYLSQRVCSSSHPYVVFFFFFLLQRLLDLAPLSIDELPFDAILRYVSVLDRNERENPYIRHVRLCELATLPPSFSPSTEVVCKRRVKFALASFQRRNQEITMPLLKTLQREGRLCTLLSTCASELKDHAEELLKDPCAHEKYTSSVFFALNLKRQSKNSFSDILAWLRANILQDPNHYFRDFLGANQDPSTPASMEQIRLYACLAHIDDQPRERNEDELTLREEAFLLFCSNIATCETGIQGGVAQVYSLWMNKRVDPLEEEKDPLSSLVEEVIDRRLNSLFSGESPFIAAILELRSPSLIKQASHQALFLKNYIGPWVGLSLGPKWRPIFDLGASCVLPQLSEKSREELLSLFYRDHFTPSILISDMTEALRERIAALWASANEDEALFNDNVLPLTRALFELLEPVTLPNQPSPLVFTNEHLEGITPEAALTILCQKGYCVEEEEV